MTFDNKTKAIKLRFSSFLLTITTIVIILIIVYTNVADPLIDAGISKNILITIVILLFLAIGIWRYMLDLHYIYFSDKGHQIILRYSSLRPFTSSKNAIVFDKEQFEGFELKRYIFGLKPYLILSVNNNFNKKVKFPPVSLSGLNKKQRNALIESLKII